MKSILKPLPKIIPVLGAPSWSPAKLSNLALWLRSDSGLYQDTGKLTPGSSDGDVVGAWEDLSGNGNDVLQATTGFKPILQNEVGELVNGYPIVSFDGADDYLAVDLGSGFDGNCALCVGIVASCDADRGSAVVTILEEVTSISFNGAGIIQKLILLQRTRLFISARMIPTTPSIFGLIVKLDQT
jgi:hypothetical protein